MECPNLGKFDEATTKEQGAKFSLNDLANHVCYQSWTLDPALLLTRRKVNSFPLIHSFCH